MLTRVATGQIQVHFGVEAGVPLTDTLTSSSQSSTNNIIQPDGTSASIFSYSRYNSETKRLLIGPAFRVEMQSGLGIEVDALYQRVDSDLATFFSQPGTGAPTSQSFEQTTANRWQFPVLIQYTRTLSKPNLRLFVEAGPSISRIGDSRSAFSSMTTVSGTPTSSSTSSVSGPSATWAGIVAGGGVDIPVSRVHLRPEFRYSHWFLQNTASPEGTVVVNPLIGRILVPVIPGFRTTQNEASFLLGVTF